MSTLKNILGKVFPMYFHPETTPAEPAAAAAETPATTSPQPQSTAAPVDVEAVLTEISAKTSQPLDWRHSIVDLLKLLNLDYSLPARKELARELHFSGNMNDSAEMNIWLIKEVMRKLAENGGRVPADLMT